MGQHVFPYSAIKLVPATTFLGNPSGSIGDVQAMSAAAVISALGLAGSYQALDSDLTAIAGLSPTNNDVLQRKSGAWTNRTMAQLYADLGLGTLATQDANSVAITGGTITGLASPSALSDAANKQYVDNAVTGLFDFKSSLDCSVNPNFPAAVKGDAYVVAIAGHIGGSSGPAVDVGDVFFANGDNAGGIAASVGTSWTILEHNLVGAALTANNLSDLANVATARSNLGLVIGTNVQAYDADLSAIAALSPTNDDLLQRKAGAWTNRTLGQVMSDMGLAGTYQGLDSDLTTIAGLTPTDNDVLQRKSGAWANRTLAQLASDMNLAATYQPLDSDLTAIAALGTTTYGRSLLTQADAAALRTTAGLGTLATQNAASVAITGGTITGLGTPSADSDAATKKYVDDSVTGLLDFKGGTDCSGNPNYPAASKGDAYVCTVSGKIGGASGATINAGDVFFATADNAGGTQASVGSSWAIVLHSASGGGSGDMLSSNNLSDLTDVSAARTNLGLVIGTNVQAYDADLGAIAALSPSNDDIIQRKAGAWTNRTMAQLATDLGLAASYQPLDSDLTAIAALSTTSFGRSVLTQADASALRTLAGLGTIATQDANNVAITGGTITGLGTPSDSTDAATKGYVDTAVTGLLDFKGSTDCSANPNYPAASKGDTYVVTVAGKIGGASGKSVDVGDMYLATADNAGGAEASVGTSWSVLEHNLVGALLAANNLSDIANAGTARTNLGLAIGTDVQAYNADLAAIAGLSPSNDDVLQRKAGAWTNRTIAQLATDLGLAASYQPLDSDLTAIAALTTTSFGRSVLTQSAAADLRTLAGLGTIATQNANAVAITGGTITGLGTPSSSSDAATKGYVDTAVTGLLEFQGSTDCSANPNYPAANKGDTYVVTVAGKIGGASGKSVDIGDMYLATADNAGGTEASVGTSWSVLEHNLVGALIASNNLSDVSNAGTARTNLGLAIGTNVQAYSAELAGVAALAATGVVARTASGTYAARTITGTTNVITVTNGDGVSGNPTLTVGSLVQRTDTAAVLTAQQNFGAVALTSSSAHIAWNLATAQMAKHTFTENTTLDNPTNMVDGGTYTIKFTQHASSPKTLAYGNAYKWAAGSAPTISATNGAVDIFTFVSDGTYMYGTAIKAFA